MYILYDESNEINHLLIGFYRSSISSSASLANITSVVFIKFMKGMFIFTPFAGSRYDFVTTLS